VVQSSKSCLPFLAADCQRQTSLVVQTSPLKTRVWNFSRQPSGRLSQRPRFRPINTLGLRGCGYKTASGLRRWLNRDPIGEPGFENLRIASDPTIRFKHVNFLSFGPSIQGSSVKMAEILPDGPNLYCFLKNTPTWKIDPEGLAIMPPPPFQGPGFIPKCLRDCLPKCALAHLPMRAACAAGCAGTGPGYLACVLPCMSAVTISQAICTAACTMGP